MKINFVATVRAVGTGRAGHHAWTWSRRGSSGDRVVAFKRAHALHPTAGCPRTCSISCMNFTCQPSHKYQQPQSVGGRHRKTANQHKALPRQTKVSCLSKSMATNLERIQQIQAKSNFTYDEKCPVTWKERRGRTRSSAPLIRYISYTTACAALCMYCLPVSSARTGHLGLHDSPMLA